METLVKNSDIAWEKTKFFVYRFLTYSFFILVPVLTPKFLDVNQGIQAILLVFYSLFMVGQWYLLGKELDHRLKIYFKVNSSMDRVIYRILTGKIIIIFLFDLFALVPSGMLKNFFWGLWVVLGFYYSWPTRGKIIKESVSTQFGEFAFLDSFEKTLLALVTVIFLISMPEIPGILRLESLKLYFDPYEKLSPQLWNFLSITYFPFAKYPGVFKLSWCIHFYFIGLGLFVFAFYSFLRYFVGRRLSLLGVFALVSSWSFSKILAHQYGLTLSSTYTLFWMWSVLWVVKSSSYRTGLFLGLVSFYGALIHPIYVFLIPFQVIIVLVTNKDKNFWYKKQTLKYASYGYVLALLSCLFSFGQIPFFDSIQLTEMMTHVATLYERKGFFILSFLGLPLLLLAFLRPNNKLSRMMNMDKERMALFIFSMMTFLTLGILFEKNSFMYFTLLWVLAFLSLIPLELVFQSITRLRSRRNAIFVIYIIICLLDSHIEGRVKIISKMFQ